MSHPQMGSPIRIASKANDVEGLSQKQKKNNLYSNNSQRLYARMTKKELDEISMSIQDMKTDFFLKSRLTKDNKTEMIMNMKSSGK